MIEITCPKCAKVFRCEKPTAEMNYIVNCPYCGTRCRITPAQSTTPVQPVKKGNNFINSKKGRIVLSTGIITALIIAAIGFFSKGGNNSVAELTPPRISCSFQ